MVEDMIEMVMMMQKEQGEKEEDYSDGCDDDDNYELNNACIDDEDDDADGIGTGDSDDTLNDVVSVRATNASIQSDMLSQLHHLWTSCSTFSLLHLLHPLPPTQSQPARWEQQTAGGEGQAETSSTP